MLNLETKEIMAALSAVIAAVVWFVRLESRGLRNKEEIANLKEEMLKLEAQRERDRGESKENLRAIERHIHEFSQRMENRFDRNQTTMEKILVELGTKANR